MNVPRISDAEWSVMKVLWEESPRTANEVVAALKASEAWHPKTVKTLLNRLVGKGALGFEREGRMYRYYPLVEEHLCVRAESESFLKRVYGGAVQPMLANILEREDLTPDDIAELRRILDEKEKES